MNQRKTNDAETSAKTCISHAAQSPIQGKTTPAVIRAQRHNRCAPQQEYRR
jgi:hypothetical protein